MKYKRRSKPVYTEDLTDDLSSWQMLHEDEMANLRVQLAEDEPDRTLVPFARRRTTGELACFDKFADGKAKQVVVLKHDGTEDTFSNFTAWFDAALAMNPE